MTDQAANPDLALLNTLCLAYGVAPLEMPSAPDAVMQSAEDIFSFCDSAGVTALRETVEAEIGSAGQRMYNGQIQTDPNLVYGPMTVRGAYSAPGLYEQIYRTEPLVYDAVRTHTETLVSGTWELQMPKLVAPGKKAALTKFVKYHQARLMSVEGGWPRAVEHFCAMIKDGFALHEVIWAHDHDAGRWFIKRFAYRFPGSLHSWIMDDKQRQLLAVRFEIAGGSNPMSYALPYAGQRAQDRRVLLQSMGGYGNDFEGVAPLRTALIYSKLKQLLIQIQALSADIFGVPRRVVRRDPAWTGAPASKSDAYAAFHSVARGRSVDGPVDLLPDGIAVEVVTPSGAMPSFQEMIDYCDRQMLVPFSNEGSLLGIASSGGAYALGEVKEREQLRTAPYYARLIAGPINDLLAHLCRDEMGDLPEYPKLVWRMDGTEDASAWLKDVRESMPGVPMQDWPPKLRSAALEKLKLPPDTFDQYDQQREAAAVQRVQPAADPSQDQPPQGDMSNAP